MFLDFFIVMEARSFIAVCLRVMMLLKKVVFYGFIYDQKAPIIKTNSNVFYLSKFFINSYLN